MFKKTSSVTKSSDIQENYNRSKRRLSESPVKYGTFPFKKTKKEIEEKENIHYDLNSNTPDRVSLDRINRDIIQKNVEHAEENAVLNHFSSQHNVNSALDVIIDRDKIRQEKAAAKKRAKEEELMKIQEEKRLQSIKALKYLATRSEVYSKYFEKRFEKQKHTEKTKLDISFDKLLLDTKVDIPQRNTIDISTYFENGTLRDYQLDGIEWLKVLYDNGMNGILADEMGLGKTVQVIAFICYLYDKGETGPFLICVPLSTLINWKSEFERFASKLPVLVFHGDKDARKKLAYQMIKKNFSAGNRRNCAPIVITTYEMPMMEEAAFLKQSWSYIIVDEGHRLKNHEASLHRVLKNMHSKNRLLLTGTPLQNNLRELWSLLHFLSPEIFTDYEVFESWLDIDDLGNNTAKIIKQEQETQALSMMHSIMKPFLLRRLKTDVALDLPPKKELIVYCPLSPKQRDLYKYVLDKNMEKLLSPKKEMFILDSKRKRNFKKPNFKEESSDDEFEISDNDLSPSVPFHKEEKKELVRLTMRNCGMMYRKIVNHPYLVHFPLKPRIHKNEEPELLVNEELITNSGKMMILDALTRQLIARGHKILIFSTLTMMLDIIEEFVLLRDYQYCRLDGNMRKEKRQVAMNAFNNDNDIKIFLISTRAGGLGLNLIGADTVILYDSDWNPQADIQAQDRCHRIGQTRPVIVYQFVTRGTIDEAIIAAGEKKRRLEKLIIHTDMFKMKGKKLVTDKTDLEYLKKLLTEEEKQIVTTVEEAITSKELDNLLDRSDLLEQMRNRASS